MRKGLLLLVILSSLLLSNNNFYAQPLSNQNYEIKRFEKVIKKHKKDRGAYLGLLYLYFDAEKDEKFLNLLKKVNKSFTKDPQVAGAFVNYAQEYYNKGKYQQAEDVIKETAKYYPTDSRVPVVYARVMMVQNKMSQAISFLKTFIKKRPREIYAYDMLINIYLYDKQYEKAFECAVIAQDKNLESIMYYFLEALSLQMIDKQKSLTYYKAYLNKLKISSDEMNRIQIAEKIYDTLTKANLTSRKMKNLIEYMETKEPASVYMVIQARYGLKHFPEDAEYYKGIIKKYAREYHITD